MNNPESTRMLAAVSILESRGIAASFEYPGYIQVTPCEGFNLNCGTVNGPFECELTTDDGENFIDLPLPAGIPAASTAAQMAEHVQACLAIVNGPDSPCLQRMKTNMNWTTEPQDDSTHIIDDGGMIYWVSAPGKTNDEIAEAFRVGYDGRLGKYDVTEMVTGNQTNYEYAESFSRPAHN
jgi:hypothetical protein